jgi:predicted Zn-ribbon and HTH transcriptional regulator
MLLLMISLGLSEQIELKEFEWYLLDHFFRQSNRGIIRFRRNSLPRDMIMSYLRYRNYNVEKINEMLNPVLNNLLMRRVIIDKENNSNDNMQSFELTSYLSRMQCSTCFYISYLTVNEPRKCLRCTSNMLHDFPKTIQKKKYNGNK